MTFIGIASFFDTDARWIGYTLVSDRRVGVVEQGQPTDRLDLQKEMQIAKGIIGQRAISFIAGSIGLPPPPAGISDADNYRNAQNRLRDMSDTLLPESVYELPLIALDKNSAIIIAQREAFGEVRLLSARPESPTRWKVNTVHRATRHTYREEPSSRIWWGPYNGELRTSEPSKKLDPKEAQAGLILLMQEGFVRESLGYDPGAPDLYFISPKEHGRVSEGRLVSN